MFPLDRLVRAAIISCSVAAFLSSGCKGSGSSGSIEDPSPNPSRGAVGMVWDPVTADVLGNPEEVAGYGVYFSLTPGSFEFSAGIVGEPEVVVRDLSSGVTYYFAVTAFDREGNESSFSDPIAVVVP